MPLDPSKLRPSERRVYDMRMENMRPREIAEKLGVSFHYVEQTIFTLRRRGAVFPKPLPTSQPLSQRVLDVVRLRRKGLSNPRIAAELGISGCQVSQDVDRARRRGVKVPNAVREKVSASGSAGRPATIRLIGTTPQGFPHRVLGWDEDEAREAWKALGGRIERVERQEGPNEPVSAAGKPVQVFSDIRRPETASGRVRRSHGLSGHGVKT